MEVKEYDQSSEQAMDGHWHDNSPVYGAFDKAESEWPSSSHVSASMEYRNGGSYLLGFCLVVRAKGIVALRW